MADSLTGEEGAEGVAAIVSSLMVEEDCGACQAAYAALIRFPASDLGKGVALAAGELVSIPKGGSGNVLLILARSGSAAVNRFNEAIRGSDSSIQEGVRALLDFHEADEWLSGEDVQGVLLNPPPQ